MEVGVYSITGKLFRVLIQCFKVMYKSKQNNCLKVNDPLFYPIILSDRLRKLIYLVYYS
jgi:hypothetical protein